MLYMSQSYSTPSHSELTVDLGIKVFVSKHHETMIQGVFGLLSMYMSLHVCHKHRMQHSINPVGVRAKFVRALQNWIPLVLYV